MSVKCKGIEFNTFYNDNNFWKEGYWHDDTSIEINGVPDDGEINYDDIKDEDEVKIEYGTVFNENGKEISSLEAYFKRWRKEQTTCFVTVSVSKEQLEEWKQSVNALTGTIKIQ